MSVAVLSYLSRSGGGMFAAASALSRKLHEQGEQLTAVGWNDPFVEADREAWSPVPLQIYTARSRFYFSPQLPGLMKRGGFDLAHLHGVWRHDQWEALRWQKRTRQPVVITLHGMLDPWAVHRSSWKKKLAGRLCATESLKKATCIHALCEAELKAARAFGADAPAVIIPNGVDLPEWRPGERTSERKQLLFLGRIHPKKGLAELLSAWKAAALAEWDLVVAGWDDGGHEAGLKEAVRTLGIEDSVTFAGPQFGEQKEQILRQADAFILPSFSEGLPMSILEAWSYGLPVLMTGFCNLPEGFERQAALEIKPDVASIQVGLGALSTMSDDDLKQMGVRGRTLVEERFTWDRVASEMQSVYAWCRGGDKPACFAGE